MTHLPNLRSVAAWACAAALLAAGASACSSHSGGTGAGTSTSSGGGTLTIQGDTGNPTLVSNIVAAWERIRGGAAAWLGEAQWADLREANRLEELVPTSLVAAAEGVVELTFELPMPGVSYVELAP